MNFFHINFIYLKIIFIGLIFFIQISYGLIKKNTEKEKYVRAVDVQAVEGRKVLLPCPLAGSTRDKVYMVLWFRDDRGIPLYSFDVRGKSLTEARHWSAAEIFGPRAHFNVEIDPASLELSDLKRHDQGVYRCRVDFKTSQTQSFRYNLTIIIPPEPPIVLNRWGRPLNTTTIGPLEEGDDIGLTCRVIGGRPQPTVKWLVNGVIVDDHFETNTGNIIENRLTWPSIQRNDLNSIYTCQAINTKLVEAKEISFVLDLYLKPLTIDIIIPEGSIVAERRYEITCASKGSRPNAIITWYKGKRQLRRTKDDIINNTTQSVLNFVPTTEDDGKTITCRAENPNVTGLFLEKIWKLDVVYPPIVTLGLGSTLSADEIKEGDDVYFECHVQANPQWRKLYWIHDGTMLRHNTTARIVRSNQSLVLQKITKSSSGNYSCSAINNEGETVSNLILLRVKYVPYCSTDKIIIVGAFRNEELNIVCSVTADPPPRSFRWKFNSSGESSEIGKENFYRNGSSTVLKYKPVNDQDFGMLSCWGINEIGEQQAPCLYQIVLAGLPSAVKNCTINNQTIHSIEIQCIGGYDGGLPQVFVLELISMKTGKLRVNITNPVEPLFIIESIENLIGFNSIEDSSLKAIIFAVNQKGRSPGVILNNFLSNGVVENETAASLEKSTQYSPIILGILLTFIILCISIIVRVCINKRLLRNSRQDQHLTSEILSNSKQLISKQDSTAKSKVKTSPRWQHSGGNNSTENCIVIKDGRSGSHENHNIDDDCDPDVIPSQYITPSEAETYSNHWKFTNHDTRPKDLLLKTSISNGSSEYILGNATVSSTQSHQSQQQPHQSDMDLNVNVIKNMLMANRVPESCV